MPRFGEIPKPTVKSGWEKENFFNKAPKWAFLYAMNDEFYIKETLKLAKNGWGMVSPNPMVGAIVVKDGKIIGKGYHKGPGFPHAEVIALNKAGKSAKGAVLYVNLEPCCHYGKTPPCTEKIIESKIKMIAASIKDPNPLVNGKGFQILKDANIQVKTGLLENEAKKLNEIYLKYITKRIPFVILKAALTINGKITFEKGKYLTSEKSLKYVHHIRNGVDAILVGINTVLKDNPYLNVRLEKKIKEPQKIILDSQMKLTGKENIFQTEGKIIIATGEKNYKKMPADIWHFPLKNHFVPLNKLLVKAGEKGITSIMVEGGKKVFTSFLKEKIVDKYYFFISPKISGDGIDFIERQKLSKNIEIAQVKRIGNDIMIEGYNVHRNY